MTVLASFLLALVYTRGTLHPRLPVIVGSGHLDAEAAQSLREQALVHSLPKACGRREVQAAILHALGRESEG